MLCNPRGQVTNVVNILANMLFNTARLVAVRQPGCQLGPQNLLQDRRADGYADAGAERAEQVGAGDDDGRVLCGGVGEEAYEGCGDACER